MDLDLPMFGDDLPEGEAFPTGGNDQHGQGLEVVESSDTVVAHNLRKKRAPRSLPVDMTQELRNTDLANMNANYLANMKEASKAKSHYRHTQMAKKNVKHWMWGVGIGGIAAQGQGRTIFSAFDRFVGELLADSSRKGGASLKRDRESGIDEATQEEARRVREKIEESEEEIGRVQEDEGMIILGDEEVEMPREEQPALDDQQRLSEMPWNITASIRCSSAVPRSGKSS